MAIHVNDFLENQKVITKTITDKELEIVDSIEKYIDEYITKFYDTFTNEIKLDLCIADFRFNPINKTRTNFSDTSRIRMNKELSKRYENVGWLVKTFIDTSGSMNEQDLWILKIDNKD